MNKLSLILLIVIRITNINKNFPTTYSFAKSKAAALFSFIFDYLKH
jgi:hypothetical protein